MKKYLFGAIIILAVVLVSGCIWDDVQIDGLHITTPNGYEKSDDSSESELEFSNENNVIKVSSQSFDELERHNEKYSTLESKNMSIHGINILFKKYNFSYINPYYYMFNLNGNYFVINSQEPLDESLLSEMLEENKVNSSNKLQLPDIIIKEETETDTKEDSSSNSDSNSDSSSDSSEMATWFANKALEKYDADGDGRLSRSEWNTWCYYEGYDSMSNCDTNGDGYCSVSELKEYSHKFGY